MGWGGGDGTIAKSTERSLESEGDIMPPCHCAVHRNKLKWGRLPSEVGPLSIAASVTGGCASSVKCIGKLKDLSKKKNQREHVMSYQCSQKGDDMGNGTLDVLI